MMPRALIADGTDPMAAPVLVAGARGRYERDALIDAIDAATRGRDAIVQAFDPAAVYGPGHLEAAARRALRSHADERAIARDLAVEIACYAAGTTQISDALATVGVPAEGDALVACAIGPDRADALTRVLDALSLDRDDAVIGQRDATLDRLGIPEGARSAVGDEELSLLVVEHVALLDARA